MEIKVNNKAHSFEGDSKPLIEVLEACGMPLVGIAVAIDNKVVRKAAWCDTTVVDGDSIIVLQAVCGG